MALLCRPWTSKICITQSHWRCWAWCHQEILSSLLHGEKTWDFMWVRKNQQHKMDCVQLLKCWNVFVVFKKDIGPGPCHGIDPAITYRGHDGTPHYSLGYRHKELAPFTTPGPGTYAPEGKTSCFQGEKQNPSYSMGARSKYRKSKPSSLFWCNSIVIKYSICRRHQSFPQFLHTPIHDWTSRTKQNIFSVLLHACTYIRGGLWHRLCQDAWTCTLWCDDRWFLPEKGSHLLNACKELHAWRLVVQIVAALLCPDGVFYITPSH